MSSYKKLLKGHRKVYVGDIDLKKSGIQDGLFTTLDIEKGEVIFIAKGKLVKMNIRTANDSNKYPNALGISRDTWLNPNKSNPLIYLNHSCEPNAGIKGKVTVVALKKIPKGTHVTIDYSTTECDELWSLGEDCNCGSKTCRKVIKSIQYLPKQQYKKYLPYIPNFFQKEYMRAH